MALKSQMIRAGARPPILTSSRRRRRKLSRWLLPATAVAAIGAAWWIFWPSASRPAPAAAVSDPLVAAAPAEIPRAAPAAAPPPRTPATPPASSRPSAATPPPAPAAAIAPAPAPAPRESSPRPSQVASTASPATSLPLPAMAPPAPPASPPPPTAAPPVLSESVAVPKPAPPAAPGNRVAPLVAIADRDPVEARAGLTELLLSGSLPAGDSRLARETLERINARLLMSPEAVASDPFARIYTVQPGDSLERIARRETGNAVDWRFLQRINGIRNPRGIQVGQKLKVPVGHFHAVIHKADYRLDLFLVNDSGRVLVRSFPVGLGELNSTPEGLARIRPGSKLVDPEWHNPRTREYFASGDPKNPIGKRWIGLVSVVPGDQLFDTYGIHGTIEPESVGRSLSMGCVRLLPEHVELVYELLTEAQSTVEIRP
jgi:lipoprotein-anchoring transpeptidase ErfK/SrfK